MSASNIHPLAFASRTGKTATSDPNDDAAAGAVGGVDDLDELYGDEETFQNGSRSRAHSHP